MWYLSWFFYTVIICNEFGLSYVVEYLGFDISRTWPTNTNYPLNLSKSLVSKEVKMNIPIKSHLIETNHDMQLPLEDHLTHGNI